MRVNLQRRSWPRRVPCLAMRLVMWLVAGSLMAQAVELGQPFRINENPGSVSWGLEAAAVGENSFVVTWGNLANDAVARRVDAAAPLSPEYRLSFVPQDLAGTAGTFWATSNLWNGGDGYDVVARHYDADGVPLSSQFVVNTKEAIAYSTRVATAADGAFMVVWFTGVCGGPLAERGNRAPEGCVATGSYGRGFDPQGEPAGDQFRIPSSEGNTRVIAAAPGQFVVSGSESYYWGPSRGERRSLDGSSLGPDFPLDEADEIAPLSGGDFVGVWATYQETPREIRIRRYAPDGTPRTEATPVVSCSDCFLGEDPKIVGGADNDFLVVWWRLSSPGDWDLEARWISATGALSDPFVVSASETYSYSDVATDGNGRFLVVWSIEAEGNGQDAWGRAVRSPAIFNDGFESGDTTSWSQAVP